MERGTWLPMCEGLEAGPQAVSCRGDGGQGRTPALASAVQEQRCGRASASFSPRGLYTEVSTHSERDPRVFSLFY